MTSGRDSSGASTVLSRAASHPAGVKSLDPRELAELLSGFGEPAFRASQVAAWLYARGVGSFDEMTDLPASLRASLADALALPSPEIVERAVSSDGTRKYLLRLADRVSVETVGLPDKERLTVCFSTQAGCAMQCAFCATGQAGFTRSLGSGEMVDQVRVVAHDFGTRVTNAVAMGQGEPFANYEATLGALRFLNARRSGLGIGARHLTVSTCGLVDGILRFAEEPEQFTLAVSLHSAVQATRDLLMPGVRGIRLTELRGALAAYAEKTRRRPSVEYALIDGVNDTPRELAALVSFCTGMLVHVNLIPANPVVSSRFERSARSRVAEFERTLAAAGIEASVRAERGGDIDAACGQLRQRAVDG